MSGVPFDGFGQQSHPKDETAAHSPDNFRAARLSPWLRTRAVAHTRRVATNLPANPEAIFTYGAPQLKFGPGAIDEIGFDLSQFGLHRVLIVTDRRIAATGAPQRIADQMVPFGIDAQVFDGVHVEPTDASIDTAVEHARESGPWEAIVAVGGGSSIDTAKAVNLLLTNPGDLMDYINVPVGKGRSPVNALLPLVAVPTTTGTGAESTTVCVLDVLALHVKTGISHPRLRPTLAVIDPGLTVSQPPGVTSSAGMDILCHALESYTARWYTSYDHKLPEQRVPYCGSNPISDMWSEKALSLLSTSFRTAVRVGDDVAARTDMALAATFAGLGFGNAGVHIPHADGYPIAGRVKDFRPKDYPSDEPLVPHGMSVALTAAEAFRFTFDANPDRHLRAAQLLAPGADRTSDPAEQLPAALVALMRDIDIPNGVAAVGYRVDDVPDLVGGALKQQRLLATCPKLVTETDLAGIFTRSMELW
jgi:hydroxyacid-oxoacid transhydrogenase